MGRDRWAQVSNVGETRGEGWEKELQVGGATTPADRIPGADESSALWTLDLALPFSLGIFLSAAAATGQQQFV